MGSTGMASLCSIQGQQVSFVYLGLKRDDLDTWSLFLGRQLRLFHMEARETAGPCVHALFKLLHVSCLLMSYWQKQNLESMWERLHKSMDMGSCLLLGLINTTIYQRKYDFLIERTGKLPGIQHFRNFP